MNKKNPEKVCPSCNQVNSALNQFCIECGFKFTDVESGKFEIIEHYKRSLYGSIVCIVIFVAFMILVTIAVPFEYGAYGLIAIPIIWPLTIGFLFWARHYLRGLSKLRRFTITDKYIEINVPHKPHFRIDWAEFDSIEITKRESMATVPTPDGLILGPRFVYFKLIFKGKDYERSYEFESGKDFKRKSRKKILIVLEQYAKEKNKGFTGWRWRDKRRAKKAAKVIK